MTCCRCSAEYAELAARYHAYWPSPKPAGHPRSPSRRSPRCSAAWPPSAPGPRIAEPLIQLLQRGETERAELRRWQRVLPALASDALLSAQWADAGPWLSVRLFILPAETAAEEALATGALAPEAVASNVLVDGRVHLLVIGRPEALQAMAQAVTTLKGSVHAVPAWLRADTARDQTAVAERLAALDAEMQRSRDALAALHQRHDLPRALGDANRLQWVLHNVHALEAGELLCWITGWSSELAVDPWRRRCRPAAHARCCVMSARPRTAARRCC